MINGFIEIYDWQYDDIDAVWCGYCPCGYQIWRAEGLPVDEDEIKESIRCMDCGQLGCVACATLNDAAEWRCFDCSEYLTVVNNPTLKSGRACLNLPQAFGGGEPCEQAQWDCSEASPTTKRLMGGTKTLTRQFLTEPTSRGRENNVR